MAATTENARGRIALMAGHCAGMVDLVALPVWVGALVAQYGFSNAQAGGLATIFLIGAVASSAIFAPRFARVDARLAATAGFAAASALFLGASFVSGFVAFGALHFLAGVAAGCALSFTHGTIAHSANPHRLFAIVGMALGVFAILFLGLTPNLIAAFGGPVLFRVFALVMGLAAVAAAAAFPAASRRVAREDVIDEVRRLRPAVWFGVLAVSCMGLTQAMMFAFVERIGIDHGFGREAVTGVLIVLGFVNLAPSPLAAALETRISTRAVLMIGPAVQALLALLIATGPVFLAFAAPTALFAGVMIFTHNFAFGALSRLDPTSRVLAGTPAMLMIGAAIGPILGGVLSQSFGYAALGLAALVIDATAIFLFSQLPLAPSRRGVTVAAAGSRVLAP